MDLLHTFQAGVFDRSQEHSRIGVKQFSWLDAAGITDSSRLTHLNGKALDVTWYLRALHGFDGRVRALHHVRSSAFRD